MKKILLAILLLLLTAFPCFAAGECVSTGLKTASAVISATPIIFCGAEVLSDGTNPAQLIIYDKATAGAAGLEIAKCGVAGANYQSPPVIISIPAGYGIYAELYGTNASYIIWYRPR